MRIQKLENWIISGKPLRAGLKYPPYPNKMPATVPNDIHLILMKNNVIQDPYIRDNFRSCAWIGETEWCWSAHFSNDSESRNRIFLNLEGVAYLASVFLNGEKIAGHRNMHRPLRIEITDKIRKENELNVFLQAFDRSIIGTPEVSCFTSWADAVYDPELCRKRTAGRKPDYTYGWDWAQGLPVCGIEGGAFLEIYDDCLMREPVVHASNDGSVRMCCEIESAYHELHTGTAVLRIISKKTGETAAESRVPVAIGPGTEHYEFSVHCKNPELWYPAGCGKQPMYRCELTLEMEQRTVSGSLPFAFREIEIADHAFSDIQGEYRFLVNGKTVYAQGVNWIPPEQIPARADDERYRKLIRLAREAGINYFRFWGGGIFERELFYDLCDENGIMIWHDFMLSGPEVPEFNPEFRLEFNTEAEYQFKRLCSHPSIVAWCGGNELDTFNAPLGDLTPKAPRPNGLYYGHRLIYRDLPEMIGKIKPETLYIPTCPTAGKSAPEGTKINHYGFGTCHRNMLHQFAEDAEFDSMPVPAFWNEFYGFSPCAESSFRKFLSDEDTAYYNTPVMKDHSVLETQRNSEWTRFFQYLSWHHPLYGKKLPFPEINGLFKEAHCELIKRYIEFLRRNMKYSGGYGYWMFNSSFPMFDLSLVDCYLTPKAAFFALKHATRPVLPVAAVYPGHVDCYLSAAGSEFSGHAVFTAAVMSFSGEILVQKKADIRIAEDGSPKIMSLERIDGMNPEDCFVFMSVELGNGEVIRNHRFLAEKRRRAIPNTELEIRKTASSVTLRAPSFAADVEIQPCDSSVWPEDSRFDMFPGESRTIRFSGTVDPASIQVRWLNHDRHSYPVQIEANQITIYNPSSIPEEIHGQNIAPHGRIKQPFTPPVEFGSVRKQTLRKFDYEIGGTVIHSAVNLPAFPELRNGRLEICNTGTELLNIPPLTYCGILRGGKSFESTSPAMQICPGECSGFDFALPEDLLVTGTFIRFQGENCPRFLDPSRPFTKRDFDELPAIPFNGESITLEWSRSPNPCFQKHGVRFDYDDASAKIYLTAYENRIKAFIFLFNVPYSQPYSGESVFRASSVEFALADGPEYRDYSLAKTSMGCEVFLRRGSGSFTKEDKQGKEAYLEAEYFQETRILAYSLELDCSAAGFSHLPHRKEFKLLINFREAGKSTPVFSGKEELYPLFRGGKVLAEAPAR